MTEEKITQLHKTFQRIFALPITRSTFRQLQNAIMVATDGDKELSKNLYQTLLTGEVKPNSGLDSSNKALSELIETFQVQLSVAKDLFENAEFINLISSDLIEQQNGILFSNVIKRIDGEELNFVTDIQTTLQLLNHFVSRLVEAEKNDKVQELIQNHRRELQSLKAKLDHLTIAIPIK